MGGRAGRPAVGGGLRAQGSRRQRAAKEARSRWPIGAHAERPTYGEFWPGYVDVLSTLLLVVTFLLSVFMVAQFYVSQEVVRQGHARCAA